MAWTRPLLAVRTPLRVYLAGAVAGLLTTAATLGAIQLFEAPASVTRILPFAIPQPVVIAAPAASAPSAEPEPADAPDIRPRALSRAAEPHLDAACLVDDLSPACQWDDGFPAISGDGRTVAMKYSPGTQATIAELSIRFYDATSGKLLRSAVITHGPANSDDDANALPIVSERAARVNAALAAAHYRSMDRLPSIDPTSDPDDPDAGPGDPPATAPAEFYEDDYAEIVGDRMRLVEPAAIGGGRTDRVLFQGLVGDPAPTPRRDGDDDVCSGWSRWDRALAWDRASGTLAITTMYRTGGCLCPDIPVTKVFSTAPASPPP